MRPRRRRARAKPFLERGRRSQRASCAPCRSIPGRAASSRSRPFCQARRLTTPNSRRRVRPRVPAAAAAPPCFSRARRGVGVEAGGKMRVGRGIPNVVVDAVEDPDAPSPRGRSRPSSPMPPSVAGFGRVGGRHGRDAVGRAAGLQVADAAVVFDAVQRKGAGAAARAWSSGAGTGPERRGCEW